MASLKEITAQLCMMGLASNVSTVEGGTTYREMNVIYLHKTLVIRDTTDGLLDGNKIYLFYCSYRHHYRQIGNSSQEVI